MLALKHATETTATVWVRRTEAGVMTVECNGQTYTGSTLDPAVDDGCGVCTVTGLAAGTSYPFVVRVGGAQVDSGTLRTMPAAGSTFSVGFSSCVSHARGSLVQQAFREKFTDAAAWAWLGDMPYMTGPISGTYTDAGETIRDVELDNPTSEAAVKAQLAAHYRLFWKRGHVAQAMRALPTYFVSDDHERPGDNWDYTIAKANTYHTWATLQSEVDNMGAWCVDVMGAFYLGNPANTHALRDPALATDRQLYFDCTVGDAHLIFLEAIEYSTIYGGPPPQMLGATQYAWLQDRLTTSTKPWKIILCGKSPITVFGAASATFSDWLTANGVTGVVWVGGDIHTPAAFEKPPLVALYAGPASSPVHNNIPNGYYDGTIWKHLGHASMSATDPQNRMAAGYATVNGVESLEIGIIDDSGNKLWRTTLVSGGDRANAQRFA